MSLLQEIVFVANNSKALKDIKQIEAEVKRIQSLGESAIKIDIDKNGIARVFSQLKSDTGAVVNLVRQLNAETGQLEEKSSSVSINYDKIAKNNAKIEAEAKRLLAQEDELARKTAERARKEQEIAEARERQSAHNQRQRDLELTFANYDDYIKRLNLTEEQLEKMGLSSDKAKDKTKQLGDQAQKTGGQFTLLNTIFLRVAHTLLSTVIRAFREAITEMKNVDTQLTVISRVTQTSLSDLENLKNKAYEVGSAYGVMASDYLSAAAAFSRAGYREQAEDLAELSSKLQIAGGVSADVANQFLIATDKAYQLNGSVKDLSDVMDKLTVIDHNYATSVEKIADGMGIVAPVAAQAHMSTEELIASLGTITAVTQRSGTEAARALRALILSIIKDTTTEIDEGVTWTIEEINSLQDALKLYAPEVVKAAEATGALIDPMEAIAALAKSYEDGLLTEAKLAQLTSSLGGKLRASQLLSLIQNYSGMYTDMLNQMETATGAVDKDIEKSLESWEVKINQLKNTFTEFVQKSLSSGFFKGMIDSVKWLIEGFGDLGTAVAIFGGTLIALKIPAFAASISKLVGNIGLFIMRVYSGVGANEAFAASFNGLSLSATVAKGAIGLIALAISAAVIAYNKYQQKLEETISRGTKAFDELKSLEEVEKKYKDLQEQYNKGTISEDEYAKGKDEVIAKLDEEGVWVDAVTGKYATLEDKIQGAINASKEYKLIEIQDAINALESKSNGFWAMMLGTGGYGENARWADYYLNGGTNPFNSNALTNYSIEELVSLYDKAVARRTELFRQGGYGSTEDIRLEQYINDVKELIEQYKELSEAQAEYLGINNAVANIVSKVTAETEDTVEATDEAADSVKGLSDELETATKALEKYKDALKGGEKGDALKSYSEAYKKAVEMYEKGLTGSNQYMSAVDLLFGEVDDYEEAGKLLGNAFVKAMFEGGGDDYGANAANYIKKHRKDFEKNGVQITEGENGTFGLMVTDMEKFAEYTGLTTDALWTLIDALDIFDSKTTYTNEQLYNLIGDDKLVNLTELINELASQGKSAKEIKDIIEAIKGLAESDGEITIEEPEDLEQTINDIIELNKEAEKDKDMEVVLTSNSEEFFDGIYKQIDQLNGTTIYIGLKTVGGSTSGISKKDAFKFWQTESRASGTTSARGGLSLVNEEGAELIYANGKAWIAGGGDPTITNLPVGAGVFNAKETREILARSGIASHKNDGAGVTGIPETSGGSGGGSGGGKTKLTKNLLEQITAYINDILKKARDALQKQLDAIDAQIEKLKREHEAEENANKLEELRLKILEAEKKLAEAENERTVRYFNKETGQWEWMADQKAVAEAQKALQDAQDAYDKEVAEQAYKAQLQALQDQKDALNDEYKKLESKWQKVLEELEKAANGEKAVDIDKLLKKLGGSSSKKLKKLLKELASFIANPTSVLDATTTQRILSGGLFSGTGTSSVATALLGASSYDLNAKGQSVYGGNTSIVGDTIYYINGVQIGSDMMNKPLSQILSVLPIYAN